MATDIWGKRVPDDWEEKYPFEAYFKGIINAKELTEALDRNSLRTKHTTYSNQLGENHQI